MFPQQKNRKEIKLYFTFYLFFIFIYLAVLDLSCSILSLHCGMWDLVPWPGIEPRPPALGAPSLIHWTTREIPYTWHFKLVILGKKGIINEILSLNLRFNSFSTILQKLDPGKISWFDFSKVHPLVQRRCMCVYVCVHTYFLITKANPLPYIFQS